MKKQYKTPKCNIIGIDVQDILAASPGTSGNHSDPSKDGLAKGLFYDDDEDFDF